MTYLGNQFNLREDNSFHRALWQDTLPYLTYLTLKATPACVVTFSFVLSFFCLPRYIKAKQVLEGYALSFLLCYFVYLLCLFVCLFIYSYLLVKLSE